MRKRILSTLLCVFAVVGVFGLPSAQAVSEHPISEEVSEGTMLRWANCASITLDMRRSNNKITSDSGITGKAGTTNITASYILERLVSGSYVEVDAWTASSNSMILSDSHETPNCPAGNYKLSVSATVTRNGIPEDVSESYVEVFK